eukprot:scaffold2435_cov121-Cylindrotheca_fusiformis.AAC.3
MTTELSNPSGMMMLNDTDLLPTNVNSMDAETREDDDVQMNKDDGLDSSSDVGSLQKRESLQESPVLLEPRLSSSCDELDSWSRLDHHHVHSFYRFKPDDSPTTTTYLRQTSSSSSALPMPPFLGGGDITSSSRGKRDKPTLLRSLAWSQDSQEERRLAKRYKEDSTTTSSTSHTHQQSCNCTPTTTTTTKGRRNSGSPTLVHWEENIEGLELSEILHRACQHTQR